MNTSDIPPILKFWSNLGAILQEQQCICSCAIAWLDTINLDDSIDALQSLSASIVIVIHTIRMLIVACCVDAANCRNRAMDKISPELRQHTTIV